jgi:hypothetical protein
MFVEYGLDIQVCWLIYVQEDIRVQTGYSSAPSSSFSYSSSAAATSASYGYPHTMV